MYGDTAVIRGLARELRAQALDIRTQADGLVGRAEEVPWQGAAADVMRQHARIRGAGLRRSATEHDTAAEALERHAAEVDRLQELIAAIEHRALTLVGAARGRLSDLGRPLAEGAAAVLPDSADELLARFAPPPSGHLAWLDVDLPGLWPR